MAALAVPALLAGAAPAPVVASATLPAPTYLGTLLGPGPAGMYPVDVTSNSFAGQTCAAAASGCYYFVLDAGNYRLLAVNRVSRGIDWQIGGTQGSAPRPGSPPGSLPVQFSDARSVGFDAATDDVYVADTANNRVLVFAFSASAGFSYLTQFGTKGTGCGGFELAYGVAVDSSGRWVYVTNGAGSVEKFSITGSNPPAYQCLTTFGAGTLNQPRQVEVAPDGDVLVTNRPRLRTQNYVYDFSSAGALQFGFGTTGTGNGQFTNDPRGVAVTGDGTTVFSTDSGGDRVEAFALIAAGAHYSSATFSYQVTNPGGTGGRPFVGLRGLATTADDHLMVTDEWGYNLHELTFTTGAKPAAGPLYDSTPSPPAVPGVSAPRGVRVAAGGDVYVMDYWNQRIEYGGVSGTGTMSNAQTFGARGRPGQSRAINFAWDIAIDPCSSCAAAGDVFLANRESHQIQAFSPTGASLFIYGRRGSAGGQFAFPQGIAFDPADDHLFVDDSGNGRIQEFTVSSDLGACGASCLTFVKSYGTRGAGTTAPAGDLNMPTGIAFDPAGSTLWVADTLNNRVQSLSLPSGVWGPPIHSLTTSAGKGAGHLKVPWGVTVAPDGSIWVADTGDNRIVSMTAAGVEGFSATGGAIGVPEIGGAQTIFPFALAFGGDGTKVYVTDVWNNRVLVLNA